VTFGSSRAKICVVGSSNIDLIARAPRLPKAGETIVGGSFHLGYGGKGANQAVTAARLGAQVALVSRVGRDVFGEGARRNYSECGIDTTFVLDDERPTGVASILVDDAAQNTIVVVPGANLGLSPADVRQAAPVIERADVLVCQLEVPVETTCAALGIAKRRGVRTILNPAPAAPIPGDMLRLADCCIPNETEAEALTGQRVSTPAEAERAARALQRRGAGTVIVTLGARGALLVHGEAAELIPAVPAAAVDPTGAGDAYIGSLAVFLAEGLSMRDAAVRANAVAALSVTRMGAQASFPVRAAADAFMRERGIL